MASLRLQWPAPRTVWWLYGLLALAATAQSWLGRPKPLPGGGFFTHYNNYQIFRQSFYHLIHQQDLYCLYPGEHADLYKYTPTFSLLFGGLALLPEAPGLLLWNLLNALVLCGAIFYLPHLTRQQQVMMALVVVIEMLTSVQNSQSNALIAGLLVLAFGLAERQRLALATLCILLTAFIKLFGLLGLVMLAFYRPKTRLAAYALGWAALLAALPLLVVPLPQYGFLMRSYGQLLAGDHAGSYGFSVMGWLHTWFGFDPPKNAVVAVGLVALLLPLGRLGAYGHARFRQLMLASVLLWMVVFNHKAESPTFVIAMAGVALWFVPGPKTPLRIALFVLAFVLTSLSPTDVFPAYLRTHYVVPYALKGVPCILIWLRVLYEQLTAPFPQGPGPSRS